MERTEPERAEWYLMQIAREIRVFREGFAKNPKGVRLDEMKLDFKSKPSAGRPADEKEKIEQTRLAIRGWLLPHVVAAEREAEVERKAITDASG